MKLYFSLLFTIAVLVGYSQQTNQPFADTVFIYKGFGWGGTTADLWYDSKAVDTMRNVSKIQLSAEYLDTLNFLIANVKSKRHFQQKIGPSFYAAIIIEGQERWIAVVPDWAIIDLQNRKQYVFRDTPYADIYDRFVDKNYR